MLELDFVLDSEKKHSVRYKHEESGMTVYVPKELLIQIDAISMPKRLQITIESK